MHMSKTITIGKDGLTATIDSQGAQLLSLEKDGCEFVWQRDPAWWGKTSPVLFPLVGAAGYDTLQSAAGPCRALSKHGFARDLEHAVKEVSADGSRVVFELTDSDYTRAMYPYAFTLNMTYELVDADTLVQRFTVSNNGDAPMPYSVGGHPAFNVPLPNAQGDKAFEDYTFRFDTPWTITSPKVVEGGLVSYKNLLVFGEDTAELPLTRALFDYDTAVLDHVPGNAVELVGNASGHGVRLEFPGFDFLGIWSAANEAPFVAIEPWTGHTASDSEDDVFEHREGVCVLAPGETREHAFSIGLI